MTSKFRSKVRFGSTLTALAALVPVVSTAQAVSESEERTGVVLDEISVTAERFRATVQTTPVAISAISADALAARQVGNVLQAAAEIPGTVIMPNINSSNNARIVMRGAGQENSGIHFDQGIGVYIDDSIQPRVNGAFFDFFDVASIEVLRGPQGTLYGRNSSGGALKIITKRPSFEWTGAAELAAGNWNALNGKAYVSGPITDKLAFSLSGTYNSRDGYLYSPYYKTRVGDSENAAQRVKLLWEATDNFELEFEYHFIQDYSEATYGVPLVVAPNVLGTQANGTRNRSLTITENLGDSGNPFLYNDGGSLHARWMSDTPWEVTYIAGYGNMRTFSDGTVSLTLSRAAQDAYWNGTEAPAGANEGRQRVEWYSHELNTTYTTENIKGVVGLYYYNEEGMSRSFANDSPTIDMDRGVDAWAIYAQGTYTFDNGLGFTVGARHTEEKASLTQYYRLQIAEPQYEQKTFRDDTIKLGVNWQITDDFLTYASYTQGFKSGGFNPVPPANSIGGGQMGRPVPYDPEYVDSYEVGAKLTMLDQTLRFNIAVFRAEYDGMQLPQFFPGTTTSYTTNATGAIVEGIEFEPTWQATDELQMYVTGSLMRGHYTAPFNCSLSNTQVVDCSGNDLKAVVPRKMTLGMKYSPELSFLPGQLTFNASWNYNSKYFTNLSNELAVFQPEQMDIFNASVAWVDDAGRYKASIESRNLTNSHKIMNGVQLAGVNGPQITGYPNEPRTVMFRVGVNF